MRLSEETIDGLLLEWALSSDSKVTERRRLYEARLAADRVAIAGKTKEELIAALKAHTPSYIIELLEKNDLPALRNRVVFTLRASDSRPLRDQLNIPEPEIS